MLKYKSLVDLAGTQYLFFQSTFLYSGINSVWRYTVVFHLPNFMSEETEVQAGVQGVEINNGISDRSLGNPKRKNKTHKGQTSFSFLLYFNSFFFYLDKIHIYYRNSYLV